MANHKSAIKRAKQNEKRNARNRSLRSSLRTTIKKFMALIQNKNIEGAKAALPDVHKSIDKAATKGVLHKNAASRSKSRTDAALKKAGAA